MIALSCKHFLMLFTLKDAHDVYNYIIVIKHIENIHFIDHSRVIVKVALYIKSFKFHDFAS